MATSTAWRIRIATPGVREPHLGRRRHPARDLGEAVIETPHARGEYQGIDWERDKGKIYAGGALVAAALWWLRK